MMTATPRDVSGEPTQELLVAPPPTAWELELGAGALRVVRCLKVGEALVLGSGDSAELRVRDRAVSTRHCRMEGQTCGLVIEDLNSKNGLVVAGVRVKRAVLAAGGGTLWVGRTRIQVRPLGRGTVTPAGLPGMVGDSAAMRRVAREVHQVARSRAPVLIQGESGTGKDLVARAVHQLSGRKGPYVPLNAAAVPDTLVDAELFGHRRGAFTGAVNNRAGAFEQAHHGTLFLDEVAELTPAAQVRLLRVVEDGLVRPVGSTDTLAVEVRLVSASWADLSERISGGRFRKDLYHRLSTVVITLPPLRKRPSDIPAIAESLLARYASELGPRRITSEAMDRLTSYSWPGNVRELGSVLYRAALMSPDLIDAKDLRLRGAPTPSGPSRQLNRQEILDILAANGKNTSAAARAAGVPRSTFRGWLRRIE